MRHPAQRRMDSACATASRYATCRSPAASSTLMYLLATRRPVRLVELRVVPASARPPGNHPEHTPDVASFSRAPTVLRRQSTLPHMYPTLELRCVATSPRAVQEGPPIQHSRVNCSCQPTARTGFLELDDIRGQDVRVQAEVHDSRRNAPHSDVAAQDEEGLARGIAALASSLSGQKSAASLSRRMGRSPATASTASMAGRLRGFATPLIGVPLTTARPPKVTRRGNRRTAGAG